MPGISKIAILLVDDKPENLIALEAVLKSPRYELVSVRSGFEALAQLLKRDFAVILLDAQMPEMDGFETAKLIRGRDKSKWIPIIFVTAVYQEIQQISLGYEAGAVDYILKPFDPVILCSKVSVFADLYEQKEELTRQSRMLIQEQIARSRVESMRYRYQDLLDRLDQAIVWEATPDLKFTFVNRRAESLLGYPYSAWFNEKSFMLKHVFEEDQAVLKETIDRVVKTGQEAQCDCRLRSADGSLLWFHFAIHAEAGHETGEARIRGISVNISSLKEEEERLAHDLKNPLSAILLNASMILKYLPEDQNAAFIRRQMEIIQRATRRMTNLLNQTQKLKVA
jgi:PAS domain S-box-containing protein